MRRGREWAQLTRGKLKDPYVKYSLEWSLSTTHEDHDNKVNDSRLGRISRIRYARAVSDADHERWSHTRVTQDSIILYVPSSHTIGQLSTQVLNWKMKIVLIVKGVSENGVEAMIICSG